MQQLTIEGIKDFSLAQTLECGQCFRWEAREDGSYIGVVGHRVANLTSEAQGDSGVLTIRQIGEGGNPEQEIQFWRHYLDLDLDYGKVKKRLCREDPAMRKVVEGGEGIHVLHQDPWETLISFLISQNNHIPRIKSSIEALCSFFGTPLGEAFGKQHYAFPLPNQLAGLTREDLAPVRLGYRDVYVLKAARKVSGEGLCRLQNCGQGSSAEGMEYLCSFHGVGKKVAHCTMLYGLGQRTSFPLDVWMKRIMNRLYGIPEEDEKAMEQLASTQYGEISGLAQQYLFYHITQSKKK
jgi:N-glycosylase/DNA lyase